jgi:phenylpropionate dioxygenase-like ring-hydroxylating dioxygenase large terminal subunit
MKPTEIRDRYWHFACHRSELETQGSFVRLRMLGDDVLVFKDKDVLVFDNLCPHRGARFLTETHGVGKLVCRYHGWSVRNGKVCVARLPGSTPSPDQAEPQLRKYNAEWCGDFLFVAIAPIMSLEAQLAGVWSLLEGMSRRIAKRMDFNAYDYECPWPIAVENALEPYHVPLIHPQSLGQLELGTGRNDIYDWSSVWYAPVQNARSLRLLERMRGLFRDPPDFEGYCSVFVFPWSMISTTFSYSFSVQSFMPGVRPDRAEFVSRFYAAQAKSEEAARGLEPFFRSSIDFNHKVFEEDHEICKRVHPSAWNHRDTGTLTPSEAKIAHFRSLFSRSVVAS